MTLRILTGILLPDDRSGSATINFNPLSVTGDASGSEMTATGGLGNFISRPGKTLSLRELRIQDKDTLFGGSEQDYFKITDTDFDANHLKVFWSCEPGAFIREISFQISGEVQSDHLCINTIADLKALAPSAARCATVQGYHDPGDGGGGSFYWDATSVETDDSGTVIKSTIPGAGRWKRTFSGALNVKWFGAKGDSSADDTAAIRDAIDSMKNSGERGIVYFPSGIYMISETIQITDSTITLSGDGPNSSAILYKGDVSGNAIAFHRTGTVPVLDLMNCAVRDLRIEAASGTYSGVGLYLSSAIFFSVERVHVRNFSNCGGTGIRIDRCISKNIISQDIYISNVHLQGNDVGLIVDGLFQGTAINLMVDQNITAGAIFSAAGAFTWQGGLVQGGGDYGVKLIGGIDCFEISGVYFETDTKKASFSAISGSISNVTVTNCRMSRSATELGHVFLEFEEVKGFFLSGNKIQYGSDDTVLKATSCVNGVVAGGHTNIAPAEQFDVTGNGLVWIGGAYNGSTHGTGIAVDTFEPPQRDAMFGSFAGEIETGTGRPSAPILGRVFFDSNLNPARPIWFNGINWVDANGSAV